MSNLAAAHFRDVVVEQSLAAMQQTIEDNFDDERFAGTGLGRDDFNAPWHRAHLMNFVANHEAFHRVWELLEDERSRTLMLELLLYRLAGHRHVRLSTNNPVHWSMRRRMRSTPSTPSSLPIDGGMLGELRHWDDADVAGHSFSFDGGSLAMGWTLLLGQYRLRRGATRIEPQPGDHVIDGGGCTGETALAFASMVGEGGHVHVFEPLDVHLRLARHNIAQNESLVDRTTLHPYGLSDVDVDAAAREHDVEVVSPGFRAAGDGSDGISVRTIDSMVDAGAIERVDFVKMDIEGAELPALRGAERTLRRFRPRLAISVYHRPTDMFTIPLFIDGLGLGYRFWLDHYTVHHEETVVYAAA